MSKIELKIESLSSAEKARILKRYEKSKRFSKEQRTALWQKRVHEVRKESRAIHLALGFLRGRSMNEMELPLRAKECGHISTKNMTRHAPDWERVEELVIEHGEEYFASYSELLQRFAEFKDGQEEYFVSNDTVWS